MTLRVLPADSPSALADLRDLLLLYAAEQGWDQEPGHLDEIRALPGDYAPPAGGAFVAYLDGRPAGCIVYRMATVAEPPGVAELRRLYVIPTARRSGVARTLLSAAENAARSVGYERLRLVSLAEMRAAHSLYEGAGFVYIGQYRPTAVKEPVFMEKVLG